MRLKPTYNYSGLALTYSKMKIQKDSENEVVSFVRMLLPFLLLDFGRESLCRCVVVSLFSERGRKEEDTGTKTTDVNGWLLQIRSPFWSPYI
jgi:hypothetical protein